MKIFEINTYLKQGIEMAAGIGSWSPENLDKTWNRLGSSWNMIQCDYLISGRMKEIKYHLVSCIPRKIHKEKASNQKAESQPKY